MEVKTKTGNHFEPVHVIFETEDELKLVVNLLAATYNNLEKHLGVAQETGYIMYRKLNPVFENTFGLDAEMPIDISF